MENRQENIYLIGPRASGKSSVGRALTARLDWNFLDMDEEIVSRSGRSISAIVAAQGWEGFRQEESSLLREIKDREKLVVATGGGIVEREQNREILQKADKVFFLFGDMAVFKDRLNRDDDQEMRPSLSDRGSADEFEQIVQKRLPWYFQCADYVLDANSGIAELVEEISNILELGLEE
jgi:shikimate kinase